MFSVFNINDHSKGAILNLDEFAIANNITIKREAEKQGARFLLGHLLKGGEFKLIYDFFGKPFLKESRSHISIAHSHGKLVVILNDKESTGVDIELIREKVFNVKDKFLSTIELEFLKNQSVEAYIACWAAKETLYKIYGRKEVEFILHLLLEPFTFQNEGEIVGKISHPNFSKTFNLQYKIIDSHVLVCMDKSLK